MLDLFTKFKIQKLKQKYLFRKLKEIFPSFDFYAKCMLFIALLSRVLFAALAVMISLRTEQGFLVSPFLEVRSGDYDWYLLNSSESFAKLKEPFIFFFQGGSVQNWVISPEDPGPIFPWLLNFFNYSKQPIILASIYLIASALLVFGWVLYYRAREVSLWGQLLLIAFPLMLWYSIAPSTELPMSIALFIFFCGALASRFRPYFGISLALAGFILMLLIRPNALSLFPAILLVLFLNRDVMSSWRAAAILVLVTSIYAYFVVYYAPYFFGVQRAIPSLSYWGLLPQQYSEGLFPSLPFQLDQLLSSGALITSKLLYASGLRPSYTDTSILFVCLRGMGGIFILPGIFYCIYKGSWLERVLVLCFVVPLLFIVGQERYLLPIAPLLLLYGGIFWKDLYFFIRKSFC
jgi:hypothetical protein